MDSINAKCPQCGTEYQLTPEQLSVADGKVRCGACMTVFQAASPAPAPAGVPTAKANDDDILIQDGVNDHKPSDDFHLDEQFNDLDDFADDFGHIDIPDSEPGSFDADEEWAEKLLEDLENEDDEPADDNPFLAGEKFPTSNVKPANTTTASEPFQEKDKKPKPLGADLEELDDLDDLLQLSKEEEDELSMIAGNGNDDMLGRIQPEPLEFKVAGHNNLLKNIGLASVAMLLLVALIGQVMYFDFNRLTRLDPWRGIYQQICPTLGCSVPERHDLNSVSTQHLSVKSHPYLNGVLLVDSLLTNHASFDQPFPTLELYFTDASNKVVAARRFTPADYLRGELVDSKLMPSRHPIHIAFEVVDPGKRASGYQMNLSYPK
ncbi:Uncharacterised protein [BD1-7 clade bacterium]|uniref:Zinc finger/thioredoxin putative domain-containing protein n=1 Tax=BD1-7 clade bacterium TaxID=2029982 RepID=A0A5S9QAS6_9GAMM|nr:Uncharacterised protein [BD1-7 clade bacterium]